MKVRMTFKTPDVVEDAIDSAVDNERAEDEPEGEYGANCEDLAEAARMVCKKFVQYGECLTVEVDTETGTCEVVPV